MTVLLIIGITLIALGSVLTGMHTGVKRLFEINMVMAVALLIFVDVLTDVVEVTTRYFRRIVQYITQLPALSDPFG